MKGAGSIGVAALWGLVSALSAGAQTHPPDAPPLPSGQSVTPLDAHLEEQANGDVLLVLRYLAPRVARARGDLDYDDVAADLDALCDGPGLTMAAATAAMPDEIVIVLIDRAVPRGVADPEATQFVGAYAPAPEGCQWQ